MSRTFTHKPLKFLYDWGSGLPWKKEYGKHCNVKCKCLARDTRRRIRHALIDEENLYLTKAIAEYKTMSYIARDKYW